MPWQPGGPLPNPNPCEMLHLDAFVSTSGGSNSNDFKGFNVQ